jgi:cell division protein FtsB
MKTTIKKINENQILMVRVLLAVVLVLIFSYLYFVNNTAFSAAAYERTSDQIAETKSEIGELELVYIEKTRKINKEMAADFGLVETQEVNAKFARRNTATKLTFNE